MQSNIEVTKNLQLWCFNDFNVCGSISNRLQQQPIQVGRIVKVHLSEHRLPNHHTAQAPRPDMEVSRVVLRQNEGEGLELGAAWDHGVEVAILRGGVDNAELPQTEEDRSDAGRVRELTEADPEAAKGRAV